MSLYTMELERHAGELRRQIDDLKKKVADLQEVQIPSLESELQAATLLLERARGREKVAVAVGPREYSNLSIADAVKRFYRNGVGQEWLTAKQVTDAIKDKMSSYFTYESLRANVGVALKTLYDEGMLDRMDTSASKVPVFAYRRKT